jgi:hypothetical protein
MVGGTVIETLPCVVNGERRVWINVRGHGTDKHRELAVFASWTPAARSVSPGDTIWWQGQWILWTPCHAGFRDYQLQRIGCSGVSRPSPDQILTTEEITSNEH